MATRWAPSSRCRPPSASDGRPARAHGREMSRTTLSGGGGGFNQLEPTLPCSAAAQGIAVRAGLSDVDWTNLSASRDLTKRPFDWSADVAKLQLAHCWSLPTLTTSARTHGRVLEGVGGGQRDAGLMPHCGPQTSRNRAEHHSLHARGRADAAGDRRAFLGTAIEGSRSRRGPEFVGRPKQLAMASVTPRRWKI